MSSKHSPSAESSASVDPVTGEKIWSAGTLTYTSGGLVLLFTLLLLGDFSWSMRERSVGPMSQWYLNSLNVPSLWFGILFSSFPAMIGLFLGPIISVKSDRHRGKLGRRIPFLLVTTPIAALGMIGLGLTPYLTSWLHGTLRDHQPFGNWLHSILDGSVFGDKLINAMQNEMFMAILCFGLFWTFFEFASIAGNAVFGGLINDVVPRSLLGRFYGLFRAVSLIDGMIFNYWLMGLVPTYFTVIMIIIGVFYGFAFLWVCLRVKEGDYPPPPEREVHPVTGEVGNWWIGVKAYFKECFSHYYYVSVFVMMMLAGLSFAPINVFALPYANSLNVDMKEYGHYLALTYLISLCLSYFLGWLADKLHPLRMALITLLGYAIVTAWGGIYATSASGFLVAWVLHGVLSGCYFTSTASLGQRLFPHSKFAQFASAAGILGALASMGLAPLVGQIIDVSGKVYRLTFVAGSCLSLLAMVSGIVVFFQFQKLGGAENYVAPGETEKV